VSEQTMRPIETRYQGYRFRSRLEARWAVFFETLGLPWQYEAEGFDLGTVGPPGDQVRYGLYLPDFELDGSIFAEVKPYFEIPLSPADEERFVRSGMLDALVVLPRLTRCTGNICLLIEGTPWPGAYRIHAFFPDDPFSQDDGPHFAWQFGDCRRCEGLGLYAEDIAEQSLICTCSPGRWKGVLPQGERVMQAYRAARAARFEHGEGG
jgi:hypothetical protein